jgi:VanZ family protein
MAVIFAGSSDAASFSHSSRIVEPLVRWLLPGISQDALHTIIVVVRKTAHVTEYAILAVLIWRCQRLGSESGTAVWPWRTVAFTLVWVAAYAATDEFHQRFVPSREASVVDVLIDTAGAVFALLLIWVVGRWRRRW